MISALSIILLLATRPDLGELRSKLPSNGVALPTVSASCQGSAGALGTGNTFGNGFATSIINIWAIFDARRKLPIGWIEKTADGRLWYEDPVGLNHAITQNDEPLFLRPDFRFTSCFSKDLNLDKLGH